MDYFNPLAQLLMQLRLQLRANTGKTRHIIDPEANVLAELMGQLFRQSPCDTNITEVVDHGTEDIPLPGWESH